MTTVAPKRILFPRGLCFSVVGGCGRAALTAANCHCSFRAQGRLGVGGSFCQAQSLEGGSLGQEAGRQGYRLATGRTWGVTGGWFGISKEGRGTVVSVCPHRPALHCEGYLRGLLWARAPDPHSLHNAPSRPSALRRLQQGLRT